MRLQIVPPQRRRIRAAALPLAILKPPVLAPVDLHQFTEALALMTRLVDTFAALLTVKLQPVGNYLLAHRLAVDRDPMPLGQLLRRQNRAKIPIALAYDRPRR